MSELGNFERALEFARKATVEDAQENHVEAYGYYQLSLEYLKQCGNGDECQELITECKERSEELRKILVMEKGKGLVAEGGSRGIPGPSETLKHSKDDDRDHARDDSFRQLRSRVASATLVENPNVKWADVAGLENAKTQLQEAVIWPIKLPHLFVGKRTPWKSILLYGPSGTGKSHLARATATESQRNFLSISASDLVNQSQARSEKLVKTLFEIAREYRPAVIFVDEIDAMVSTQTNESESDGTWRVKTEFLVQMDDVGQNNTGVLVIGATNVPWRLDNAMKRRFEKCIYTPFPGREARIQLFKFHLGLTPYDLKNEDFSRLAEQTEGYSASDILIVVRNAIMQPVRRIFNAKHFKEVNDANGAKKLTPCAHNDTHGKAMSWSDVGSDKLMEPVINATDFWDSFKAARPTDVKKYDEWAQELDVN